MLCAIFISFGVELAVQMERKGVSRMWENAYLSIKNPKASGPLSRPWTLIAINLLHSQLSASEAGPHLLVESLILACSW